MSAAPDPDPVRAQRARFARLADVGQRTGYLLFAAAIALFVFGSVTGFETWIVVAVVACLAAGSVVLAPAIILGYAVKAAERDDRERGH